MKPDTWIMILNSDPGLCWHLLFPAVRMFFSIIILISAKQLYQKDGNVINHIHDQDVVILLHTLISRRGPI